MAGSTDWRFNGIIKVQGQSVNVLENMKKGKHHMDNKQKEQFYDIFTKYQDHPRKYIRISWSQQDRHITINGVQTPLEKALLIYQVDNQTLTNVITDKERFQFFCRPKRHVAFVLENENEKRHYKVLPLGDEEKESSELFVCILETTDKNTFVLAFVNGFYLIETYDFEYTVTLYSIIETLLKTTKSDGKEVPFDEKEAQVFQLG